MSPLTLVDDRPPVIITSLKIVSEFTTLTGQLADKPTRGQSSPGLDNSQTSSWSTRRQRIFKNHGITILYLYIKPNPNPNSNPIEYWQRINSVICLKEHLELLYTANYKSNISAS